MEASRSLSLANSSSTLRGTVRFMAPELLNTAESQSVRHTKESDIWAFGMTVLVRFNSNHISFGTGH